MAEVIVAAKGMVGKLINVQAKERREGNIEVLQLSIPHGGAGLSQEALGFLNANVGKTFIIDVALDDGTGQLELETGEPPEPEDDDGDKLGVEDDG